MKRIVVFLVISFFLLPVLPAEAATTASRVSGRIVLQVQSKGEAWYVSPTDSKRYFLGRPEDAFALMRSLGLGISNSDLKKIPVGLSSGGGADTDKDGLPNDLESAIGSNLNNADTDGDGYSDKDELISGYNLNGGGKASLDPSFAARQRGAIFLQVQSKGEAWYVSPTDSKRYFLGRPADAFAVMRALGLGISNADLSSIGIGALSGDPGSTSNGNDKNDVSGDIPLNLSQIEQKIHVLINAQRTANGLPALKWNEQLAAVAREHSGDQAEENLQMSDLNKICNYATIHHEGLVFGLMPADRLNNRGVSYYSKAGENIALIGAAEINYLINLLTFDQNKANQCQAQVEEWNNQLKADMESLTTEAQKVARLNQDLAARKAALAAADSFQISNINWKTNDTLAEESVTGWMNSPGHRANILDAAYDEAGIGVAYVNGYIIATQVFIKRSDCGYKNGPCCERNACYLPTVCSSEQICR